MRSVRRHKVDTVAKPGFIAQNVANFIWGVGLMLLPVGACLLLSTAVMYVFALASFKTIALVGCIGLVFVIVGRVYLGIHISRKRLED